MKEHGQYNCIVYSGYTNNLSREQIAFQNESTRKQQLMSELQTAVDLKDSKHSNYFNSMFVDRSAEVKHAQTPIYTSLQQTHSPQLPIPSPNYPVQTKLSTDFDNSCEIAAYTNDTILQIPNVTKNLAASKNKEVTDTYLWDLHLQKARTIIDERANDITIKNLLNDNDGIYNSINEYLNSVICTSLNLSEDTVPNIDTKNNFDNNKTDTMCVVLNIPTVNACQPPEKKQKLSKIDIATHKRKLRRQKRQLELNVTTNKENEDTKYGKKKQERIVYEKITTHRGTVTDFGVQVFGYSDSSSSSSYTSSESESDFEEADVNDRSNLSVEPKFKSEKLEFLQLFGLTTFLKRNVAELSKLERRKWKSRWICPAIKKFEIEALDLPVPSGSPTVLNTTPDYHLKSSFFRVLELQSLSKNASEDYEKSWIKIVEDRIKRKCESAITEYSLKAYKFNLQKLEVDEKPSTLNNFLCNTKAAQFNGDYEINQECSKKLNTLSSNTENINKSKIKLGQNYNKFDSIAEKEIQSKINSNKIPNLSFEGLGGMLQEVGIKDISNTSNQPVIKKQPLQNYKTVKLKIPLSSNKSGKESQVCCFDPKIVDKVFTLKTPQILHSLSSACQQKNCKTIHTQTDNNFVLPLTMILLDNRSLPQEVKTGKDTLRPSKEDGKTKSNISNKKTQCSIKEEVMDKEIQCKLTSNIDSMNIKCLLQGEEADVQTWSGIEKVLASYQAHTKECDSKIESLKKALNNLKEDVSLKQTESKYLERKLMALQSASYLFEKERLQLQKAIDCLTDIINAFR